MANSENTFKEKRISKLEKKRVKEANKMIQGYALGYITDEECSEMIDLITDRINY